MNTTLSKGKDLAMMSMLVIYCYITNYPKLWQLKTTATISQFLSIRMQGHGWVGLAQGLSLDCGQDISGGCNHLKAQLGLEHPPASPLTQVGVEKRLWFLTM